MSEGALILAFQDRGSTENVIEPANIEAKYNELGHQFGWRFLTCPAANIEKATTALITINPGGAQFEGAVFSVEAGSAYVVEAWKNNPPGCEKLQRQVRRMFELINAAPENALSGYLVPFRSRDWASLPQKEASLEFGIDIWKRIAEKSNIRNVIGFGKEIGLHLASIFSASFYQSSPAGWGGQTIDIYKFGDDGRLLVLPHLSRFGLFHRPGSEAAFLAAWNA